MERKVVMRSQQLLSVVFVSVIDLRLVWSEIVYALLSLLLLYLMFPFHTVSQSELDL